MIEKFILALGLLAYSLTAHASLIEYNGYSRNTNDNVVISGGLEWLMWTQTNGMSINQALATYSSEGWMLASNTQMAGLFNNFGLGNIRWKFLEEQHEYSSSDWTLSESQPEDYFHMLFGSTYINPSICTSVFQDQCALSSDNYQRSAAVFGSDSDRNGWYMSAFVHTDYQWQSTYDGVRNWSAVQFITSGILTADERMLDAGVALVRFVKQEPNPVTSPGAAGFLILGFLSFAFRRYLMKDGIEM